MTHSVVVVGAGWSGLSSAVELVERGFEVTLIEAAREPGGRAREIRIQDQTLDNGQHLLIGAYEATLALMRRVGAPVDELLVRHPLNLLIRSVTGRVLSLKAPRLPAPLHLLVALLGAGGLPFTERLSALLAARRLLHWSSPEDISVGSLLERTRQPSAVVELLWEPLCLAALNTHPREASAEVFVETIRASFGGAGHHSDLLMPRDNLSALLTHPALHHLRSKGVPVHLGESVKALRYAAGRLDGVVTRRAEFGADDVVLAVDPRSAAELLAPLPDSTRLVDDITRLGEEPIVTVYLRYADAVTLPLPFIGLVGSISQWIFDRSPPGQPGTLAVVISGSGPHQALDNPSLLSRISAELTEFFPDWPQPTSGRVVREKRATFRPAVGCSAWRPGNKTAVPGLWLAGDYTDTGLPPTLEGGVRSGLECARLIAQHRDSKPSA